MVEPLRCPKCEALEVVPIVYGLPGEELLAAGEAGEVFLGGCVVSDEDPAWRCRVCRFEGQGDPSPVDRAGSWASEFERLEKERSALLSGGDDGHPVERLWAVQDALPAVLYPPGVVPAVVHIAGTAAFPGGAGLYVVEPGVLPPFPVGGVMIVAHDLDAEDKYLARVGTGVAHGDPARPMRYWLNVYRLFGQAGLELDRCFFTNVYVGLRSGSKPSGPFPGRRDRNFTRWSRRFLDIQAELMAPRLVVLFGDDPRKALGLDPGPGSVSLGGRTVPAVALAHPSFHPASARGRQWAGLTGVAAEAALLRYGRTEAGPHSAQPKSIS